MARYLVKYNICIPLENPQSNTPQNRFRMCNIYQTDDVEDCVEELSGYLLDHFPANIEVKGTTTEEDHDLLERIAVMKKEVEMKLALPLVKAVVDSDKKS
jgi:hypothetical protein